MTRSTGEKMLLKEGCRSQKSEQIKTSSQVIAASSLIKKVHAALTEGVSGTVVD